jgi:hypothetical protein
MDDKLKCLFDYTKFHIGMYATLLTAIIGVFANDSLKNRYCHMVPFILATVVFFLLAGAAGGLVASSTPGFSTFDDFCKARLGPWNLKLVSGLALTHIEHTAFWVGILVSIVGLFLTLLLPKSLINCG